MPLADVVRVSPGRPAGETEWLLSRAAVVEEVGQKRTRWRGTDREFDSLREYVAGDELRRMGAREVLIEPGAHDAVAALLGSWNDLPLRALDEAAPPDAELCEALRQRFGSEAIGGLSGGGGGSRSGASRLRRRRSSALRPPTVSEQFRKQLNSLTERLTASDPIYVRCVKPNETKRPNSMDAAKCITASMPCSRSAASTACVS